MDSASSAPIIMGVLLVYGLFLLTVVVLTFVGLVKMFEKAGKPGWVALIPIYNSFILYKIAGRSWWWVPLTFIPFVGFVISLVVALDVARVFGKGTLFGVFGLWLFSPVGYAILGLGEAKYLVPGDSAAAMPLPS